MDRTHLEELLYQAIETATRIGAGRAEHERDDYL